MIATPQQSLEAAAEVARAAGITPHILSDELEGESREVGKVHAALARAVARRGAPFRAPCVILSGGETTVTVRKQPEGTPRGRGGRAGEFCLGLAQALQGQASVWALAADTDGIDGIEDNAGAFVAPDTLSRAQAHGMKADAFLDRNDAYGFFSLLRRPGDHRAHPHQRQRFQGHPDFVTGLILRYCRDGYRPSDPASFPSQGGPVTVAADDRVAGPDPGPGG
jgi:glycerate-2-kinase